MLIFNFIIMKNNSKPSFSFLFFFFFLCVMLGERVRELCGQSLGNYKRTNFPVCPGPRAPFIPSELLRYWHAFRRIKFQLTTVDPSSYCVQKCVGEWNAWYHWYLICVFLRRVDKDRSGVISDSELQQALSNGMCSAALLFVFCPLSSHLSPFLHPLLCAFFIFLWLPLFWSLWFPPMSSLHTIALYCSLI